MKWMDAVKKWNADHNPETWCIPRKGTTEYFEVRAIMEGKPSPKKTKIVEERREKAVVGLRAVEKETADRNKARKQIEKMAFPPMQARRKKVSVKIDV